MTAILFVSVVRPLLEFFAAATFFSVFATQTQNTCRLKIKVLIVARRNKRCSTIRKFILWYSFMHCTREHFCARKIDVIRSKLFRPFSFYLCQSVCDVCLVFFFFIVDFFFSLYYCHFPSSICWDRVVCARTLKRVINKLFRVNTRTKILLSLIYATFCHQASLVPITIATFYATYLLIYDTLRWWFYPIIVPHKKKVSSMCLSASLPLSLCMRLIL